MTTAKKKLLPTSLRQQRGATIDIFLLVFPQFLLLDATGPIQVFSSANDDASDAGLPLPYRIHLISQAGGVVVSSAGVSVVTEPLPRRSLVGATLIVAGGRVNCLPEDAATLRWISRTSEAVARCCAVISKSSSSKI